MGGFLNLRLKKWVRALITRSFAIVPTIIVALFFDTSDSTMDMLNESVNVLQSVQVPFALIPLLTLVSKEQVMGALRIGSGLKLMESFPPVPLSKEYLDNVKTNSPENTESTSAVSGKRKLTTS